MNKKYKLEGLIKNLKPQLHKGLYVYITNDDSKDFSYEDIIGSFREDEGITIIIEKEKAESLNLEYTFIASWITLRVYSSLEAVGLTARVATALANEGISCNAIAAYHHDHIFVPYRDTEKAMSILRNIQ